MAGTGGEGRQSTAMRERRVVPAGGAAVLAEVAGRGMMSHLFLALSSPDPAGRSGCLVKIYVDGEETPAIVSDVDGLFGGFSGAVFKSRLIGCDGVSEAANGFGGYFYFDIPFAAGLRVELENGSAVAATQIWSIVSYALGGDQDRGRRRRLRNVNFARTAAMLAVPEYAEQTLAEIAGRGALFGLVFFLQCGAPSWRPLEGNFRFYVDGETAASWESSGTEDYFGGSFYFNGGAFAADFLGAPLVDHAAHRLVGYRFHIPDPIVFDRRLKVTWANGEAEVGPVGADAAIAGNVWYYTDR